MNTEERRRLGDISRRKANNKIYLALEAWNYEKQGEPTAEKLSKLIPMGMKTVMGHLKDFESKIEQINQVETDRLALEQLKRDAIKIASEKYRLKSILNTDCDEKLPKDDWGF